MREGMVVNDGNRSTVATNPKEQFFYVKSTESFSRMQEIILHGNERWAVIKSQIVTRGIPTPWHFLLKDLKHNLESGLLIRPSENCLLTFFQSHCWVEHSEETAKERTVCGEFLLCWDRHIISWLSVQFLHSKEILGISHSKKSRTSMTTGGKTSIRPIVIEDLRVQL